LSKFGPKNVENYRKTTKNARILRFDRKSYTFLALSCTYARTRDKMGHGETHPNKLPTKRRNKMANEFVGRSPLQAAEDELLDLAVEVCNVSRAEAVQMSIQRRVINKVSSAAARELLERWTGSSDDIKRVTEIHRIRLGEMLKSVR
jgi:hypothetical protein